MIKVKPLFDLSRLEYCMKGGYREELPGQVGKGSKVQIADNTQWGLLLGIVHQNGVLRGYSIHNPIW